MRPRRLVSFLLLICFLARSQDTNAPVAGNQAGGSATNLSQALKALLASLPPGFTVSTNPPPPPPQATANVYATRAVPPSSLRDLLSSLNSTMVIRERNLGDLYCVTCAWPDVAVRFSLRPTWEEAPRQRRNMRDWIVRAAGGATNAPAVDLLLGRVDGTVACISTVIEPDFDAEGKVSALLRGLAAKVDGCVFAQSAFYDAAGAKILGATNAPVRLGARLHGL